MAKLTNKDYFIVLSNVLANYDASAIIEALGYEDMTSEDVEIFVSKQIESINKRKEADAKKRAEKPADALTEAIYAALTTEPVTAETVLEKVIGDFPENDEGKPTSVAMVRARLSQLYKNSKIDKTDITVGEKSKKAYFIASTVTG